MFPIVLLKLVEWILYQLLANSCYRAARKVKSFGFHLGHLSPKTPHQPSSFPSITKCDLESRGSQSQTLVCDIHRVILRSHSFFPYFMLVAFEGGSIFRAFVLLLSCPVLWILDHELKLKVMTFITFSGLRVKNMENISRAVLPKFYLENLNLHAYEVLASAGSKVVFTSVPRVMVEGFLKEYLSVGAVIGTELHAVGGYFTGLLAGSGLLVKHRALKEYFGDRKPDIGIGSSSVHDHHLLISLCKVSLKLMILNLVTFHIEKIEIKKGKHDVIKLPLCARSRKVPGPLRGSDVCMLERVTAKSHMVVTVPAPRLVFYLK